MSGIVPSWPVPVPAASVSSPVFLRQHLHKRTCIIAYIHKHARIHTAGKRPWSVRDGPAGPLASRRCTGSSWTTERKSSPQRVRTWRSVEVEECAVAPARWKTRLPIVFKKKSLIDLAAAWLVQWPEPGLSAWPSRSAGPVSFTL